MGSDIKNGYKETLTFKITRNHAFHWLCSTKLPDDALNV